jgi:predicted RNase H-like HicB family nuclease
MTLLEEYFNRKYPMVIYWIEEENSSGYYFAYLLDFGYCACSATGDTIEEALQELELVKKDIIQHFWETGKEIPDLSKTPF